MASLHIILDIDGTLMDTSFTKHQIPDGRICDSNVFLRPGTREFIDWCLQNCSSVSIWTAACKEWLQGFLNLFDKTTQDKFLFTWDHKHYTPVNKWHGKVYNTVVKELQELWDMPEAKKISMNKYNTLIIEDTPTNCILNPGNAIIVPGFNILKLKISNQKDNVLSLLQKYLIELSKLESVLHVNKLNWLKSFDK